MSPTRRSVSPTRRVPMVDLPAQYASLRTALDEAISRVLATQRFIGGPEVEALEGTLASLCGTEFAVACASGSDALMLSLQAAGVGPGDDVLCPAFTFFATAGAVARLGARPVFVDVDPDTLDVGPPEAEAGAARCRRLRAMIPVDLFGRVAPMGPLCDWAEARNVAVIEDSAQAIGARDPDGTPAGARGLAGCFSFFPSKNLGGFGDGGVVTSRSEPLVARLRELRNHGQGPDGLHRVVGTNSRLDAIQAAVLRVKLLHLSSWTKQRGENADFYDQRFAESGALPAGRGPADAPLRTPPPVPAPAVHVYNQYVVRVRSDLRDALRTHLAERGVETRVYYERGLHHEPCFAGLETPPLPATEAACHETLALPVHPELSAADREHVAESVLEFLSR